MTIGGPKIQTIRTALVDNNGQPTVQGLSFLHSMQQVTYNLSRNGPSTSRPTATITGRWIGMQFYDTTLGKPIFLHGVNPDVWHDGAGNVV